MGRSTAATYQNGLWQCFTSVDNTYNVKINIYTMNIFMLVMSYYHGFTNREILPLLIPPTTRGKWNNHVKK